MYKIHRTTVDAGPEKKLLINMITSTKLLEGMASFYDPDLIEQRYARTVAEWCMRHFGQHHEAPGVHIKDIFDSHEGRMEETERNLVFNLLSGLSNEYEKAEGASVKYMLSSAGEYFKARSLLALSRRVSASLSDGNTQEAENLLTSYKCTGGPEQTGRDLNKLDGSVLVDAFEQEETSLFTFPGRLGWLLNGEFTRSKFFAILGPEKRGKTWWLNEVAVRAAKARRNVTLFQVGDMSEDQVLTRTSIRLAGRSNKPRYCERHETPVPDCLFNQLGQCKKGKKGKRLSDKIERTKLKTMFLSGSYKDHVPCVECRKNDCFRGSLWYKVMPEVKALTGWDAAKSWRTFQSRTRNRSFMLSVHPSNMLSVAGIDGELNKWEASDGFVPDVIVIDYADNLAPENLREENYRLQQVQTWKSLRSLSQKRDCLVVTATQANAASYDQETLEMKNFSESKLKYAEVTAMIGLNQTPDEKIAGIMRINMIVAREGEFFSGHTVKVAQDLWRGKPCLFSF